MSSPEIRLLQEQKDKAIQDCDFQKAKSIDVHMKRLAAQIDYNNKTKKKIDNELLYESEKEAIKKEASKIFSESYEEIYRVKAKFQERFSNLHKLHAQQLKNHAEAYSCDLEICSTRGVPEAVNLKKEAQVVAKNGGFDEADAIFKESKQVMERTIAEREEQVHKTYALKTEQIQKKHEEENNLCKEKEKIALNEVIQTYSINIGKLKKRLAAAATKYQVQPNDDEEDLFFPELNIEEEELLKASTPPQSPSQTPKSTSATPTKNSRSVSGTTTPKSKSKPLNKTYSKAMTPEKLSSPSTITRREKFAKSSTPQKRIPMKMSPSNNSP